MMFDPFFGPGPRWFSIDAHRPFLEDLADGVLAWLGERDPEALSDAVVLLPNRRAARAFSQALARRAGDRAVLLPEVRPLGDLEEDEPPFSPGDVGLDLPPAIDARARRFELARLIVESDLRPGLTPVGALGLADALSRFLDSCQIEEVEDLSKLDEMVSGDLARHWQESAKFLRLATERWPARLAELGMVDPAWRRSKLLRLLAQRWTESPPDRPVLAAGSTGTAPAAAAVLKAVAAAPRGAVVVPGLDRDMADDVWSEVVGTLERPGDAQHPQHALARLLTAVGVEREGVRPWFRPAEELVAARKGQARGRVLAEALRPAETTGDWQSAIDALRREAADVTGADPVAEGLEGLSVLTAETEEDAAAAIAVMMREALETPGRTCALVTPDLDLSRRVSARLERWGVVADSSSGSPLSRTPAGRLLSLSARVLADPMDPQALLGLLKHPAVTIALEGYEFTDARRGLERLALRGPRLRDFTRARAKLLKARSPRDDGQAPSETTVAQARAAEALLDRMEALIAPARAVPEPTLDQAARTLTGFVEAVAGLDAWAGNDGEAAAALLAGLIAHGAPLGELDATAFARLLTKLVDAETVRAGDATHPSLRILGAIEARLVRADRVILAGLEEGVWPGAASVDPLLSRPMRAAVGLPPPEKRLGQTAQDFIQAASSPEVVLVERRRRGGQPAVPSRWLWRLRMLAKGAGVDVAEAASHLTLARALDAPTGDDKPAKRPRPTPPVARRPRKLPVTAVERWVRDPYSVYARYVLGLKELDRPGRSAEALARGTAVHRALERLVVSWPEALPEDCEGVLHDLLIEELGHAGFDAAAMAREGPLARNCARTLSRLEAERRARGIEVRVEESVQHTFAAPAGPFTVTAKADRIEISAHGAAVMDFKTGQIPSKKQIKAGFAPQLTLTGAILAEAGLKDHPAVEPEELTYVRVTGRDRADEVAVRASGAEAMALSTAALEGLKGRVARFDHEDEPYVSWAAPQFMGNFGGNYDHLARVWEWHVAGGGEGDEA